MPEKRKDGRNQSSVTVENPITGEQVKRFIDAYDVLYPQAEKHSYPSRYRNPRNLSRHLGKIKGMQTEYYLYPQTSHIKNTRQGLKNTAL